MTNVQLFTAYFTLFAARYFLKEVFNFERLNAYKKPFTIL